MDAQFLSSVLANALGGLAACLAGTIVCLASKKVCAAIVRRRTSRLPKGTDAERAAEELEGITRELHAAERAQLAANLLLRSAALSREIAERAAERATISQTAELSREQDLQPRATQLQFTFGPPTTAAQENTTPEDPIVYFDPIIYFEVDDNGLHPVPSGDEGYKFRAGAHYIGSPRGEIQPAGYPIDVDALLKDLRHDT